MNVAGRRADVINSSWGYRAASSEGSDATAIGLDGFAKANPRTLLVVAAGNEGPGPDKVRSPGSAYNDLTVAALGPNPPYNRAAFFSSGVPMTTLIPSMGRRTTRGKLLTSPLPARI